MKKEVVFINNISGDLEKDIDTVSNLFSNFGQLIIKRIFVGGVKCAVICVEGLVNKLAITDSITTPLATASDISFPLLSFISQNGVRNVETKVIYNFDELSSFILSGYAVVFANGEAGAVSVGVQGFPMRSVGEPMARTAIRGSREGFVEVLDFNIALVRRRLKTPNFKAEINVVGRTSKTRYCICYLSDMVSDKLLDEVKKRIAKIDLDVVLETGNLQPFLEKHPMSIFSDIGITERPDSLAGKLSEGRIGLIVDGSPIALIIPFLFSENFQGIDDYSHKYYYASFIRILKYLAFFTCTMLPGIYIAVGTFNHSAVSLGPLLSIAKSEHITPLPLMIEGLLVYIFYEIIREAGMNLPKSMGHAVSIVGAIVIGEAAVSAGIVGGPMVVVLSLTVISSFLLPDIFIATTVLRFGFILVGGLFGLFGVFILMLVMGISIVSINSFGVPYTAPLSPFSLSAMRDTIIRTSWVFLGRSTTKIQNLSGSEIGDSNDK